MPTAKRLMPLPRRKSCPAVRQWASPSSLRMPSVEDHKDAHRAAEVISPRTARDPQPAGALDQSVRSGHGLSDPRSLTVAEEKASLSWSLMVGSSSYAVLAAGRASGSLPKRRTYASRSSWSWARSRSLMGSALPAAMRRCRPDARLVIFTTATTSWAYCRAPLSRCPHPNHFADSQ